MKTVLLFIIVMLFSGSVWAQYKPADQGSALNFTIKNFGIDVSGKFTGLLGSINFDPANTAGSTFDITVDASTVNTDNSLRDSHLREDSYFNVKSYPKIHFVSTKVTGKNGSYNITGKLTIKKQTKTISFPFTAVPQGDGYLFKGGFSINRRDFDVGGFSTIADNLDVQLNVLAKK